MSSYVGPDGADQRKFVIELAVVDGHGDDGLIVLSAAQGRRLVVKTLSYPSGEAVMAGDHVRYLGEAGIVEVIADAINGEEAAGCYAEKFSGGGVMITSEAFGRVFLSATRTDDHLEFVARREQP
jgi:hypothetical protein